LPCLGISLGLFCFWFVQLLESVGLCLFSKFRSIFFPCPLSLSFQHSKDENVRSFVILPQIPEALLAVSFSVFQIKSFLLFCLTVYWFCLLTPSFCGWAHSLNFMFQKKFPFGSLYYIFLLDFLNFPHWFQTCSHCLFMAASVFLSDKSNISVILELTSIDCHLHSGWDLCGLWHDKWFLIESWTSWVLYSELWILLNSSAVFFLSLH
jgi:hypothetical protein